MVYVKKDEEKSADVEILNVEEVEMKVPEIFTYEIPLDTFVGTNTTIFAEVDGVIIQPVSSCDPYYFDYEMLTCVEDKFGYIIHSETPLNRYITVKSYGLNGLAQLTDERVEICDIQYGVDELCEFSYIDVSDLGECNLMSEGFHIQSMHALSDLDPILVLTCDKNLIFLFVDNNGTRVV